VPCIVDFKIRFKVGIKYDKVKYSTVIKYRSNILLKDTDKQINSFVIASLQFIILFMKNFTNCTMVNTGIDGGLNTKHYMQILPHAFLFGIERTRQTDHKITRVV
jgi:hypothetical protein